MKFILILTAILFNFSTVFAFKDNFCSMAKCWSGSRGEAKVSAKISVVDTPDGVAIRCDAVSSGPWQGMGFHPSSPIDLNKCGSISFEFKQNVQPEKNLACAILIFFEGEKIGIYRTFQTGKEKWAKVTIPVDLRSWQSTGAQNTAKLGKVREISFYPFRQMDKAGQSMMIRNLQFHPKNNQEGKIQVASYKYLNAANSGDDQVNVLTDGRIDKDAQAFWRQYSDDPDIVFDLGTVYLVNDLHIDAVAVPSQNISDITIFSSNNGEKWIPAGHLKNTDMSGSEKIQKLTKTKLNAVGRYFRIIAKRARTDFPIRISEVSFSGKIPTDKEIEAVVSSNYNIGPQMPECNTKDYWKLDGDKMSVWVNRQNGVIAKLQIDQQLKAERIFNRYELSDGKTAITATGYEDKVVSGKLSNGVLYLELKNPQLPEIKILNRIELKDQRLIEKIEFISTLNKKAIFYSAKEVVLGQNSRNDGVYETWGAGHDMQRKFASEVVFDLPADTSSVMIFESRKNNATLLHYRYRYNNRYVQIGSGKITIAGFGDKRTVFTPTGWIIGDCVFALDCPKNVSIETHLAYSKGDLTAAFDKYLSLPEVHNFRKQIERPECLKDIRLNFFQGWNGFWGDNSLRMAEWFEKTLREGSFIYVGWDSNSVWGEFPTTGKVMNLFGGELTVEQMKERDALIRRKCPHAKVCQYTWLWSAAKKSKVVMENPEWFVRKDAEGKEISFFPGFGVNYYRLVGIDASANEIERAITRYIDFYDQDGWYLDGGGSSSTIDWYNLRVDEPDAWDRLLLKIRKAIKKNHPERFVFFNNPENPIGDMGFLESFGGLMTSNWREGAAWMYKFELWQRPAPLFQPLYIYWLPGVDGAFQYYMVGLGLGVSYSNRTFDVKDIAFISAQQQSRFVKMVDAELEPNWRYDPETTLEAFALKLKNAGWIFIKSHAPNNKVETINANISPLGITNTEKPLYQWQFKVRDARKWKGIVGEKEAEQIYRNTGWSLDFVAIPELLGQSSHQEKVSRSFNLKPEQLTLWMFTQSPALVYSVDQLRTQLWLPDTLGVSVDGAIKDNSMKLQVSSTRKAAEIIALVPDGMVVDRARIDGKNSTFKPFFAANATMAIIPVEQGEHSIELDFVPQPVTAGSFSVSAVPASPGGKLQVHIKTDESLKGQVLAVNVTHDGNSFWNGTVDCVLPETRLDIQLPKAMRKSKYEIVVRDLSGKVKTCELSLDGGKSQVVLPAMQPRLTMVTDVKKCDIKFNGIKITGSGEQYQEGNADISIDPSKAKITIGSKPMYLSHWNAISGGLEMQLKRYVKVRLSSDNLVFFNNSAKGRHFVKNDQYDCCAALNFDFDTPNGYTVRSLASIGKVFAERKSPMPDAWGCKKLAQNIYTVSFFIIDSKPSEILWLDTKQLGAPADWNGRVWIAALLQNVCPNRKLSVEILDTSDTLPQEENAAKVYNLKNTSLKKQTIAVPKVENIDVNGKLTEDAWKNTPVCTGMTFLGSPDRPASQQTSYRLCHDGQNLYVGIVCTEADKTFLKTDQKSRLWLNDSIELYFRVYGTQSDYVQLISDSDGNVFAQRCDGKLVGGKKTPVSTTKVKTSRNGDKWYVEVAIPLPLLGISVNGENAAIAFNFARNRYKDGNGQFFTLAPGKKYTNFDGFELLCQ